MSATSFPPITTRRVLDAYLRSDEGNNNEAFVPLLQDAEQVVVTDLFRWAVKANCFKLAETILESRIEAIETVALKQITRNLRSPLETVMLARLEIKRRNREAREVYF